MNLLLNLVKILSIDYSEALALDGVIGKVDANDIPGENEIIVMWQKEHCDKVWSKSKLGSVFPVIVVSILPHAKFR